MVMSVSSFVDVGFQRITLAGHSFIHFRETAVHTAYPVTITIGVPHDGDAGFWLQVFQIAHCAYLLSRFLRNQKGRIVATFG